MPNDATDLRLNQERAPLAWNAASLRTIAALGAIDVCPHGERPTRFGAPSASSFVKLMLALLAGLLVADLSARLGDMCATAGSLVCGP